METAFIFARRIFAKGIGIEFSARFALKKCKDFHFPKVLKIAKKTPISILIWTIKVKFLKCCWVFRIWKNQFALRNDEFQFRWKIYAEAVYFWTSMNAVRRLFAISTCPRRCHLFCTIARISISRSCYFESIKLPFNCVLMKSPAQAARMLYIPTFAFYFSFQ